MCKMYCLQVYLMFKKHQFQRDCVNFQKKEEEKPNNNSVSQRAESVGKRRSFCSLENQHIVRKSI